MPQNRNERLAADYREMLRIQNRPYLTWSVTKGELPYAEEYLMTVRLRSYVLTKGDGSYIVGAADSFLIRITLWDSYPYIAPNVKMLSIPPVFHPDWYSKGSYCPSASWRQDDSLKDFVLRMLKTLKYDPQTMETVSPANYKALEWYQKNQDNVAWFPSDKTELSENTPQEAAAIEKAAETLDEIIDSFRV